MTRETAPSDHDKPSAEAVANDVEVVAPLLKAAPIDGDWPDAADAADDRTDDDAYGDPANIKNESPLESLGEAVSQPLRDAAEDDPVPEPKSPRP